MGSIYSLDSVSQYLAFCRNSFITAKLIALDCPGCITCVPPPPPCMCAFIQSLSNTQHVPHTRMHVITAQLAKVLFRCGKRDFKTCWYTLRALEKDLFAIINTFWMFWCLSGFLICSMTFWSMIDYSNKIYNTVGFFLKTKFEKWKYMLR